MPEEKKQSNNNKNAYDVNKARKIVLDLIGENEIANKNSKKTDDGILITKRQEEILNLPLKSFAKQEKREKIINKQDISTKLQNISAVKEKIKKENDAKKSDAVKAINQINFKSKKLHKPINLIFIFFIFTILFIAIYCTFTILIINFNIDNKATRKIANYLPIPAYISSNKIIEYYEFIDILNKHNKENKEAVKLEIISSVFGKNPDHNIWSLID